MMKRASLLSAFLLAGVLAGAAAAFGLDFGATVDNTTGYVTNASPAFEQTDKLALWLDSALGDHLMFRVQGSGDYTNQALNNSAYVGLYADLDQLDLSGTFTGIKGGPALFAFSLGRFTAADPTGDIYDQMLDGVQATFGNPGWSLVATVGYTGLTIKPTSTIVMSKADSTGLSDTSQYFGSARAVGMLSFTAPTLFLQQDLTITAIAQEDLRPLFSDNGLLSPGDTTYSASNGGPLDSQYFTAGLTGPLAGPLYWTGTFTLETGRMLSYLSSSSTYAYEPILAYLATAGVHYYRPDILGLAVTLDSTYASGDADFSTFFEGNTKGDATAFIPVTQGSVATVFSPQIENIVVTNLSASIKPFNGSKNRLLSNMQVVASAIPFVKPTAGPVSESGVVTGGKQYYLGTEFDGSVNYRPFSDLGVSLSAGAFVPNADAFSSSGGSVQYGGKLDVSMSF